MIFEVFKYVVRGLYEEDKNIFILFFIFKIDFVVGKIKYEEFMIFIKGGVFLDLNVVQFKFYKWIVDLIWFNLVELSNFYQFLGIFEQVKYGGNDGLYFDYLLFLVSQKYKNFMFLLLNFFCF